VHPGCSRSGPPPASTLARPHLGDGRLRRLSNLARPPRLPRRVEPSAGRGRQPRHGCAPRSPPPPSRRTPPGPRPRRCGRRGPAEKPSEPWPSEARSRSPAPAAAPRGRRHGQRTPRSVAHGAPGAPLPSGRTATRRRADPNQFSLGVPPTGLPAKSFGILALPWWPMAGRGIPSGWAARHGIAGWPAHAGCGCMGGFSCTNGSTRLRPRPPRGGCRRQEDGWHGARLRFRSWQVPARRPAHYGAGRWRGWLPSGHGLSWACAHLLSESRALRMNRFFLACPALRVGVAAWRKARWPSATWRSARSPSVFHVQRHRRSRGTTTASGIGLRRAPPPRLAAVVVAGSRGLSVPSFTSACRHQLNGISCCTPILTLNPHNV
jgi:hypothetical protein